MKFLVIGAGLMGGAAAYDLARGPDTEEVVLADRDLDLATKAATAAGGKGACPLRAVRLDAADRVSVRTLMQDADSVLSAVPYHFNLALAEAALETRCHFCDLGGNNDVVDATLALDSRAKEAGVSIVPDCGLAPGQVSVLTAAHVEELDSVESIRIRVGGLPLEPRGALRYQKVFSVNGLLNEYVEPVRVLRGGEPVVVEPLSEIERLEFPAPFGELEAFTTSGGISTLVESYRGVVRDLDYKTIRYPGHATVFRALWELGFMSRDPIEVSGQPVVPRQVTHDLLEAGLPSEGKDVALVRVESIGVLDGKRVRLRHQGIFTENAAGHTAMMQTTAYAAAIVARMMADGRIEPGGARPQERCVPTQAFLEALEERGIGLERSLIEL